MEPDPVTSRYPVTSCPVCQSTRLQYQFPVEGFRILRCEDCGLVMTNPQPSDEELGRIYGEDYFLVEKNEEGQRHVDALKQGTADLYLDALEKYGVPRGARLLEVGSGQGDFLARAQARGMEVTGVEYSEHANGVARAKLGGQGRVFQGEIQAVKDSDGPFDVVAFSDVIEHVRDPVAFLRHVYTLLRPGGVVFVATPTRDSWSAKLLGQRWMEYKPEHLWYFNAATLRSLLSQHGFTDIVDQPGVKTLSFDYIAGHFARYQVKGITPVTNFLRRVVPFGLRRQPVKVVASGMVLIARRQPPTAAAGCRLADRQPVRRACRHVSGGLPASCYDDPRFHRCRHGRPAPGLSLAATRRAPGAGSARCRARAGCGHAVGLAGDPVAFHGGIGDAGLFQHRARDG